MQNAAKKKSMLWYTQRAKIQKSDGEFNPVVKLEKIQESGEVWEYRALQLTEMKIKQQVARQLTAALFDYKARFLVNN